MIEETWGDRGRQVVSWALGASVGTFLLATGAFVYRRYLRRFVPPIAKRATTGAVAAAAVGGVDALSWVRDDARKDPEVLRLLERENLYADAFMRHTAGLQHKLLAERQSRCKSRNSPVPRRSGNYMYYTVLTVDHMYERHCRKLALLPGSVLGLVSRPMPQIPAPRASHFNFISEACRAATMAGLTAVAIGGGVLGPATGASAAAGLFGTLGAAAGAIVAATGFCAVDEATRVITKKFSTGAPYVPITERSFTLSHAEGFATAAFGVSIAASFDAPTPRVTWTTACATLASLAAYWAISATIGAFTGTATPTLSATNDYFVLPVLPATMGLDEKLSSAEAADMSLGVKSDSVSSQSGGPSGSALIGREGAVGFGAAIGLEHDAVDGERNPNVEEVVLDVNALAKGHAYCDVAAWQMSGSGRLVAYSIDTAGSERYTIKILDIATGTRLSDTLMDVGQTFRFVGDTWIYYTRQNDAGRCSRCYRHKLGSLVETDELLLDEPDATFWLGISWSSSGAYLFVKSSSWSTSQFYFLSIALTNNGQEHSASATAGKLAALTNRRPGIRYEAIDHSGSHFWIVTNDDGASNCRLCRVPISDIGRAQWRTILEHEPHRTIQCIACLASHVIVFGLDHGITHVQILDTRQISDSVDDALGSESKMRPIVVQFPETIFRCSLHDSTRFTDPYVRVAYESHVTPESILNIHLVTGKVTLVQKDSVPGYDRSLYESKRIHAAARDGSLIPISLVYRKDKLVGIPNHLTRTYPPHHLIGASLGASLGAFMALIMSLISTCDRFPTCPLCLCVFCCIYACAVCGYGSYGMCMRPWFDVAGVSLLDRGIVVAYAHVRGGGELGSAWRDGGRLMCKKNTFDDFIAVAEHLIQTGWTQPSKMAIRGDSAGGLLVGAVLNARPDLFRVALTEMPFVDLMSTMSDSTLPLTIPEYEEWGNPADEKQREYMLSYSPVDNVKRQNYPAMLVHTALNDARVPYWEAVKWVQKLRQLKTDTRTILLKCAMTAGHSGDSGRSDAVHHAVHVAAFLLDQFDIKT